MKRKLIWGMAASLALIPALQAKEAAVVAAATPNAKITCQGISGVPMTVDAEQTIPLQLVAMLRCGQPVSILAENQGYTVPVRTADGHAGYVAALYVVRTAVLAEKSEPVVVAAKLPVSFGSAKLENGIATWEAGANGCDQFMSDGYLVESMTVNDVTVQVALRDTGWKLRANVAVVNAGSREFKVDPAKFRLDSTARTLEYQDPDQLARTATHQVLWTTASATPTRNARVRASSTATGATVNIDFTVPPDATANVPNYLVEYQYAEDQAIREQSAQTLVNVAQQVKSLAFKPGLVEPNSKTAGAVWFARDKNVKHLLLRVPVDGHMFEFPLSFNR